MTNFFDWKIDIPPKNTWVWIAYSLEKNDWQIVKTCKNGCCVQSSFGSMILPNFWYFASAEDIDKELIVWKKMSEINLTSLYGE